MRKMMSTFCWTLCFVLFVQASPARKRYEIEDVNLSSDADDINALLEFNRKIEDMEYIQHYMDILKIENDVLSSLLNDEYSRNSKGPRKIRKRILNSERNRRSFDSISHMTGGFGGQNVADNPTLRRLRELAALHQQRMLASAQTTKLPHGTEILFPILQIRPN